MNEEDFFAPMQNPLSEEQMVIFKKCIKELNGLTYKEAENIITELYIAIKNASIVIDISN